MSLSIAALAVAQGSVGEGKHNPEFMRQIWEETGPWPGKGSGDWCSIYAGWQYRRAITGPLPFALSRGAKRFVRNVGEAGRFLDVPEPGALIVWHRGWPISWKGHIARVEFYRPEGLPVSPKKGATLQTIEGNILGGRSARRWYTEDEWRRRLYRIAII